MEEWMEGLAPPEEEKPKKKHAAALKYNPAEDEAPIIAAVGSGAVAENIVRIAEENDVPVVEEASTAEVLAQFSVGDAIPPVLYEAVAQVLMFVAEMDTEAAKKFRGLVGR